MTILNPQKTVQIGSIEVTVRDLPWPVMKQFLDRLSNHLKASGARMSDASFFDELPAITASASDLAEYLICATTGYTPEALAQRSSTEFLALLDASLEVVFNEHFIRLGKSVAERMQGAFSPMGTTLSAKRSISSSGKDGATRTRVDSPLPNSSSSAT